MTGSPFHLAVTVRDLDAARRFYVERLGCRVGRSAPRWVDLDLYGHQVSLHLDEEKRAAEAYNPVDGDRVPVPHFGVVLELAPWRALAERLTAAGTEFVIEPHVRFPGEVGEQATMFLRDPSGNALEFKAFGDVGRDLFRA
jgi:hypothetical protein